ncbi:23S rRNA (guanosine-2'-O-)-methyltransferase RlmB [Burkholderiales bacterium]|nr:MAG: 23S rRNA (guanosine(2251)-2'-O)-methyltransferase RlmB [Burkholderiales bacterium]CAG0982572.1 23S rRNA (guanosine-2'-O-)-methyltransferase RlmB [Burkholderiales bacterium]
MGAQRIVYGFHAVTARLRQAPETVKELMVSEARQDARMRDLLAAAARAGVSTRPAAPERLDGVAGHARHQGVVALVDASGGRSTVADILEGLDHPALLLVLDGVQDPHNLGACLRSCDAFGVDALILPKDRAVGINATVAKVACGAVDTVPVITVTNLTRCLRELQEQGVWVLGADAEAKESLFTADLRGPLAWVLGAEGSGLRRLTRDTCDRLVNIPLSGTVASLNVSVATGICLYATRAARATPAGQ